jgi:hypothetical protein
MKTIFIYAACWIGMVVLAILNGIMRESLYKQYMHELTAHQVSTLILLILFGIYVWFLTGLRPLESAKQALLIGVMWCVMTVVFEFVFGHYVAGHTWSKLFQDYNLVKGRLWSLVLIWTTIAPYLYYRIRSQ